MAKLLATLRRSCFVTMCDRRDLSQYRSFEIMLGGPDATLPT